MWRKRQVCGINQSVTHIDEIINVGVGNLTPFLRLSFNCLPKFVVIFFTDITCPNCRHTRGPGSLTDFAVTNTSEIQIYAETLRGPRIDFLQQINKYL